jgi:RimJ/RimL family protein N-acetyltransferase
MISIIQIETKRLNLRALTLSDASELFNYRSNKIANKFQSWIPDNINSAINFINNKIHPEINICGTWFQLGIIHKSYGKLIGDIGIHFLEEDNLQVELGYTLDKDYQRQGYAIEALKAVIDYIFNSLNKHRITASILADNYASIRLIENLQFRKEAHFHKSFLDDGIWLDDTTYAILKEEWSRINK